MTSGTRKGKFIGSEARFWWLGLQPPPVGRGRGDRGALARLRRADSVSDALSEPATHALLHYTKADRFEFRAVATVAMVLADVRKDDPDAAVAWRLAQGAGEGASRRVISPERFALLMMAADLDDTLLQFRRLMREMDSRANVADLANAVFEWTDPVRGDRRRDRWKLQFHGALDASELGENAERSAPGENAEPREPPRSPERDAFAAGSADPAHGEGAEPPA